MDPGPNSTFLESPPYSDDNLTRSPALAPPIPVVPEVAEPNLGSQWPESEAASGACRKKFSRTETRGLTVLKANSAWRHGIPLASISSQAVTRT